MVELVFFNNQSQASSEKDIVNQDIAATSNLETEVPYRRAIVPTVDVYTARILFNFTQKIVEDTVDRRMSLLEKHLEERDKEIMRSIRRIQAQTAMRQSNIQKPWWRKLFKRGK